MVNFFLAGLIFNGVYYIKLKMNSIFWWTFFWLFFNFFLVARYLTVTLRGPVLKPKDEGASPSSSNLTVKRENGRGDNFKLSIFGGAFILVCSLKQLVEKSLLWSIVRDIRYPTCNRIFLDKGFLILRSWNVRLHGPIK